MSVFTTEWLPGDREEVRILRVAGPFTLAAVFDFQAVARQESPPVTIIDLTDVPYMDSAALGSVIGLHVSCQKDGRKYALAGASDRLKTLFRVAGVDGMLVTHASVAEAQHALTSNSAGG